MKKYFVSYPSETSNRVIANSNQVDSGLQDKSIFNAHNNNPHIEVFKNLVLKDIEGLAPTKRVSPDYIKGIKLLEERKAIIIRPADKGDEVVVMNKPFYHNQLLVLLGDGSTYKRLVADPTESYKIQLNSLVELGFRT